MDPAIIAAVAAILFAPDAPRNLPVQKVYRLAPAHDRVELDDVLRALAEKRMIRLSLDGITAQPTIAGKTAFEDGSLTGVVLGLAYVADQLRDAVVHIIVESPSGESGATGFFVAEYDGCIVTAAHAVRNRDVLRIEDRGGNIISRQPETVLFGPPELDIAVIRCPMPEGTAPLRIEWRPELIEPLDEVLILGYPPFPNHQPALFHARASIHATPLDYRGRKKLVISSITRPGCSGGPVISIGGFVVGIVEQENNLEQANTTHTFFTATVAHYLSEIMPPQ